jgi:hypothetical protein
MIPVIMIVEDGVPTEELVKEFSVDSAIDIIGFDADNIVSKSEYDKISSTSEEYLDYWTVYKDHNYTTITIHSEIGAPAYVVGPTDKFTGPRK